MDPAIERLIRLQQLETDAGERKRRLADLPARVTAADTAVEAAKAAREAAAARLAENQAARRTADRELGIQQGRLTKFKDQLMEVKTNKEYTAMQHEIATAEEGVRTFEDQILTLMMEADDLGAALKAAEGALASEQQTAASVRGEVDAERTRLEGELGSLATARATLEAGMPAEHVRLFADTAAKRRGVAVSEVRDGHCSTCQVRLRPQLIMEIRRGEQVIQCESCSRILYVPPPAPAAAPQAAAGV
jgi:predicted  nucleic acid-binding Zn-ribbon protein